MFAFEHQIETVDLEVGPAGPLAADWDQFLAASKYREDQLMSEFAFEFERIVEADPLQTGRSAADYLLAQRELAARP